MDVIYMKFNKKNSATLIKLKPEWAKFMHSDGCLHVKLLKAHYGLAMAGMLWYKELVSKLAIIEYYPTKNDICVFTNHNNKGQLNVHVDDLLITGIDNVLRHIIRFLQSLYPTLKAQFIKDGPVEYLASQITRKNDNSLFIDQSKYGAKVMRTFNITGKQNYPYPKDLFDEDFSKPADYLDAKTFSKLLMSINYAVIETRPDMALSMSFLSTKMQNPSVRDCEKCLHLAEYWNNTLHLGIRYKKAPIILRASMDASLGSHPGNGRSQNGFIFYTEGGGPIQWGSHLAKQVSTSSTMSELINLSDNCKLLLPIRDFLNEINYIQTKVIIEQDNKSTISLAINGRGNSSKSRYINIRHFWMKELIDDEIIDIHHTNTEKIRSDSFTKTLFGSKFFIFRSEIMNID